MRNYKGIIIGIALSMHLFFGLTCLITAFVAGDKIGFSALKILVPTVHFAAVLTGCTIAGRVGKDRLLLRNGIVFGAAYILIFALNLLVFDNGFSGVAASMLAGIAGFGLSLILSGWRYKGAKKRYFKRRVC